jgi:hypothetical protein
MRVPRRSLVCVRRPGAYSWCTSLACVLNSVPHCGASCHRHCSVGSCTVSDAFSSSDKNRFCESGLKLASSRRVNCFASGASVSAMHGVGPVVAAVLTSVLLLLRL